MARYEYFVDLSFCSSTPEEATALTVEQYLPEAKSWKTLARLTSPIHPYFAKVAEEGSPVVQLARAWITTSCWPWLMETLFLLCAIDESPDICVISVEL